MPDFFLVRRFSWLVVAAPLPGGGASGGVVSSLVTGVSLEGLGSLVAGASLELDWPATGVWLAGSGCFATGVSSLEAS